MSVTDIAVGGRAPRNLLRLLTRGNVLIYLVALIVIFSSIADNFMSTGTLVAVVSISSLLMVVSAGITLCLLAGEVDLSVGAVVGLSSTVAALLIYRGLPWPVAIIAAVLAGGAVGAVNGLLTARLASINPVFPSFFPTLAMTAVAMGIAEALEPGEQAIAIQSPSFSAVFGFSGTVTGGHWPLLYAVAVLVLAHFIVTRTSLGYKAQAVGANRRAARFVGINVAWTKFWVMTASGLFAGFAGVLTAGFFQSGYSQLGQGYELSAIGAAVIGGTALFGGRASVLGAISGVLVLSVLEIGLLLVQVTPAVQMASRGTLVILAVAVDLFLRRRLSSRQ